MIELARAPRLPSTERVRRVTRKHWQIPAAAILFLSSFVPSAYAAHIMEDNKTQTDSDPQPTLSHAEIAGAVAATTATSIELAAGTLILLKRYVR